MQAEKVAQERQLLTKIHCLPVSSIPVYGLLGLHGARNTKLIIFQLLSTLFKIHPQKKKKAYTNLCYPISICILPLNYLHTSRARLCLSGPYRTIIHT